MNKFSLRAYFPQNYLIRKPLMGAIILFLFGFGFAIVYRPLRTHASPGFDYASSMAIYMTLASMFAYLTIRFVKKLNYFKDEKEWTLLKEIIAVYLVIQLMGVGVYFCGFILDNPSGGNRWTFSVFFDSALRVFLIEIFPFGFSSFFTYLRFHKPKHEQIEPNGKDADKGKLITINSSLKKESLSFYEDEFLFAESDANYVIFHLLKEDKNNKVSIRNSISNIEKQLSINTKFIRTHRAFIVNLDQVSNKSGNALGYQLNLKNSSQKIPVSRQNVKAFDLLFKY